MSFIPARFRRVRQQQQKHPSPREKEIRRLNKRYVREERRRIRFKKLKQLARPLAIGLTLILIIGAAVATFWGLPRLPQLTTNKKNVIIGVGILVTMILAYLVYKKSRDNSIQRRERGPVVVQQPQQTTPAAATQQAQPATPTTKSKWLLRPVTALLVTVIVIGLVRYERGRVLNTSPTDFADTTRTRIVRPGQPAEAVMPPGWQMDGWGDMTKFDSHVIWRGRNKVRVFTTKAGVESAEIKIRVYPCSAEASC